MDESAAKRQIEAYLERHRYAALATVTEAGHPIVHTVGYASQGATLYCATFRGTRKVANVQRNPHVAYTVDEDYDNITEIQGVQMEGVATVLEGADAEHAAKLLLDKFPFFEPLSKHPEVTFLRIEPVSGFFIDYTREVTHRDPVWYRSK